MNNLSLGRDMIKVTCLKDYSWLIVKKLKRMSLDAGTLSCEAHCPDPRMETQVSPGKWHHTPSTGVCGPEVKTRLRLDVTSSL